MSTVRLVATAVHVTSVLPPKPSSVVGAPPQWSDGSDATYAEVWLGLTSTGSAAQDWAYGSFDPIDFPEGATLTDVTVNARYSTLVAGGATARDWGFSFLDSGLNQVVGSPTLTGPADAAVHEASAQPDYAGWEVDLPTVQAALSVPFSLAFMRFSNGSRTSWYYGLRVYEVSIDVTYSVPAVPVTAFAPAPPARLSGRMDGAFHGARRMDARGPSRRSGFRPGGYY